MQTFAHRTATHPAPMPRAPARQLAAFDFGGMRFDGSDMDAGTRERTLVALQQQVGNAAVQALLNGSGAQPARPANVAQRISSARGAGRSLEPSARSSLEGASGFDLSSVRVHDDAESHSLATTLNAAAFTSGTDIFFSRGAYSPTSSDGYRVLSHEVAHVVQQSRGPVSGRDLGGGLRVSERGDAGERAADRTADTLVQRSARPRRTARTRRRQALADGEGETHVQRCGSAPCDCPAEKKQAVAESLQAGPGQHDSEQMPVQRLARPPTSSVFVQRAPQPLEPLGDFELMFNPTSSIDFLAPGATSSTKRSVNDTNSTATFSDIPRGSSGTVELDVAMQWFTKQQPGPGPTPKSCDLCQLLSDSLTITIPVPIPGVPNIKIRPLQSLVAECQKRIRVDVSGVRDLLDEIADAALDPCGKLLSLLNIGFPFNLICAGIGFLPVAPGVILALQRHVGSAVRTVRAALKECEKQDNKKTGPRPATTGQLAGSARSIMTASFTSTKNGQLTFSGLPPQASFNGTGARLVIPVDSLRAPQPTGGQIAQQPTMLTTSGATGAQSRQFTVNIAMRPAPADADYDCAQSFGPFKVGKPTFENEDGKIRELRDFYFGLHPKVREDLEEGRGLLRVTGRASKTGTQQSNLTLGEQRAARVRSILQDFAGSDARLRVFSLGELGAQTLGCPDTPEQPARGAVCEDANERRADVQATGTIFEAGELDSKCSGHLGEATPGGSSRPVTEAEGPETVGLSEAATKPLVRLNSRGAAVSELQQLLNQLAGTDLGTDGIFGQKTHEAVVGFQKSQGLDPDGIVGRRTWSMLFAMRG